MERKPATTVLLIRHAQTAWNVLGYPQGHRDVPLDETGHAMAEVLADALAGERLDAVYSSDLRRASQTAEPVAARHGVSVITDKRLRESRLRESHPSAEFPMLDWHVDLETEACCTTRMGEAMREIAMRHAGRRVAVVSHGFAIRLFLHGTFANVPPGPEGTSNTRYHALRYERGTWHAERFHIRDHLERAALVATGGDAG